MRGVRPRFAKRKSLKLRLGSGPRLLLSCPVVIACPFCRAPLAETAPACPRCQLDFGKTRQLLGPAPPPSPTKITDLAGALAPEDEDLLRKRLEAFHGQFPQCRLGIVLKDFAPQFPLGVHLFWLLNTAPPSGGERKHGRNRDLLLALDPARGQAGLIVGYGLEPFLPQSALEQAVDCASPQFKAGQAGAGLLTVIDRLSALMEGICGELPAILGLDQPLVSETGTRTEF